MPPSPADPRVIVASTIAATATYVDPNLDNDHIVAADGSVIRGYPGYQAEVQRGLQDILGPAPTASASSTSATAPDWARQSWPRSRRASVAEALQHGYRVLAVEIVDILAEP